MPGMIQAVPGTDTIYATMQASLPRWFTDDSILWTIRWSSHGLRGPKTQMRGVKSWTYRHGRWPYANRMSFCGDPASGMARVLQHDVGNVTAIGFEPWCNGTGGTQSLKFIMGQCLDESSVGVSGAVVQGFLTANDQFVRETTADSNGRYELGTEYPGAQHYLVAYRTGGTDIAGTTVNTLVPTNRDGT